MPTYRKGAHTKKASVYIVKGAHTLKASIYIVKVSNCNITKAGRLFFIT